MAKAIADTNHHYPANFSSTSSSPPPIVYGEISILGYNGYIPTVERNGRRNRSKFLLCKRPAPNGIKKSRHYVVKQPQATKAIKDKDLHSISYTFSRSQTIIVEYRQDENTDMFQIGRSSEDPIDFVVIDTLNVGADQTADSSSSHHHHHHNHNQPGRHNHNENNSNNYQLTNGDPNPMARFHRLFDKAGGDMLHYDASQESSNRLHQFHRHLSPPIFLNYPQPNISNLPPLMADIFRSQESSMHQHYNAQHGHSSGVQPHQQSSTRGIVNPASNEQHEFCSSRHNLMCKRSNATQSTISRFACRILVDRKAPYTARIYAAGFDSSKNIFLGEKATKWEQDDSIDGLTTNGVLLMHPKQGRFYEDTNQELEQQHASHMKLKALELESDNNKPGDKSDSEQICSSHELKSRERQDISSGSMDISNNNNLNSSEQSRRDSSLVNKNSISDNQAVDDEPTELLARRSNDSNNNNGASCESQKQKVHEISSGGGVWREVSVDGGIYAIRESRSAAQKGTRIENETNVLQDGTLIDLCGATLLWRSVDGFKASPTKKSLEEKIDMLNASRPQCPVGLNTLVIPRKPILPTNQHHRSGHKDHHHNHHHNNKDSDKNSHQPYVYLKCGHVQGYHDWGTIDKSNQRTCPICLSVGTVAKLSMGLEPSFYVDSGPLTHVFNPCGHTASERTVRYWCSIKIPHGTHFFHSICPFCAIPVATNEPAATRLIFQDDLD